MLLAALGETLHCLSVEGNTGLLHGFVYGSLQSVPNIRQLSLDFLEHQIDPEDFAKGIACLR